MQDLTKTLEVIKYSTEYQTGIKWGGARLGHPEGKIRDHIAQLERNLLIIEDLLSVETVAALRLLIHTHDTFKYRAGEEVPVASSKSHPALAAKFLSQYTDNSDIINIARYHDTPFASWCDFAYRGSTDHLEFKKALQEIQNYDLFATFLLIDGLTEGKHSAPIEWSLKIIREYTGLSAYVEKVYQRLKNNARNFQEEKLPIIPLVTERKFHGISYLALGPIECWGADIYLAPVSLRDIRDTMTKLAEHTGARYAAVISNSTGQVQLHLSRYPRRVDVAVLALAVFRKEFEDLLRAFKESNIKVLSAAEETAPELGGVVRATVGLARGYSETRKNAFLTLLDAGQIKSIAQARNLLSSQIDLESLGVNVNDIGTLDELSQVLRNKTFAKIHTRADLDAFEHGSLSVQEGSIVSVGPDNYLYQEACLVLRGKGRDARAQIFDIAKGFRQARFMFESLSAHETVTIELPEFSTERAAQLI